VPDIDLVVDMAHLNVWRTPILSEKLQVLQIAQNRILEIHISDNDGYRDTHTTIGDHTWWIPYITTFPTHVPIVLESRRIVIAHNKYDNRLKLCNLNAS
jgi:sugar phosphate isomerase/epimerase